MQLKVPVSKMPVKQYSAMPVNKTEKPFSLQDDSKTEKTEMNLKEIGR